MCEIQFVEATLLHYLSVNIYTNEIQGKSNLDKVRVE